MFRTRLLRMHNYREVKSIYFDTFDLHDDADFFAAWRNRDQQSSMGLFYRGTLIGFGIVTRDNRLWFLAVARQFRGDGAGSILLNAILKTMDSCHLTPVNDSKIIAWYQRHGFRISGLLPTNPRFRVPLKEPWAYKPSERWALSQPRHIMAFHRHNIRSIAATKKS